MSGQHTPGPWSNKGRNQVPGLPHSAVVATTLIARVYSTHFGDDAQEEANADLIAAAPDLLAALIGVVKVADRATVEFDAARAAIAKATGGEA